MARKSKLWRRTKLRKYLKERSKRIEAEFLRTTPARVRSYKRKPAVMSGKPRPTTSTGTDRDRGLIRRYGITEAAYNKLLAEQGGVCKICGRPPTKGVSKVLQVDHDHKSGSIRGLLCHGCNVGLSGFEDNRDFLMAAISYLLAATPLSHG